MDMQPLTASLEPSNGGNHAKGQSVVFGSRRPSSANKKSLSKAPTTTSVNNYEEQPPSLLMASLTDSSCDLVDSNSMNTSRSPSKFPLLGSNSKDVDSYYSNNNSSSKHSHKMTKKQSKKAPRYSASSNSSYGNNSRSGGGGGGFKISRALFRERDPFGNFSNMDFVASDATGNHKKKSKSRFVQQHQALSEDVNRSLVQSPTDEQMSFDATSTTSDPDEPLMMQAQKLYTKQQPKCVLEEQHMEQYGTTAPKTPPAVVKKVASSVEDPFSICAAPRKGVVTAAGHTQRQKQQYQKSSLEYTASPKQMTPVDETADPLTDSNIPSDIQEKLLARFDLSACAPPSKSPPPTSILKEPKAAPMALKATTSPAVIPTPPTPTKPPSSINQKKISVEEPPKVTPVSKVGAVVPPKPASNSANKTTKQAVQPPKLTPVKKNTIATTKIQPLKPPPALPPKAPRKQQRPSGVAVDQKKSSLRHHEQRLLKGGNFLQEESNRSSCSDSTASEDDLVMKILGRLERSNKEDLMTKHYNQDPSISEMNNQSSSEQDSSSNGKSPSGTPARRRSSSSSVAAAAVNNISYAALNTDSDKSGSSSASRADGGGGGVEECKINYLYSQDNEFENSILSPSISSYYPAANKRAPETPAAMSQRISSGPGACNHKRNSPVSPSRYRSDAINAFIEKSKCPTECGVMRELNFDEAYDNDAGLRPRRDMVDDHNAEHDDDHIAEDGPNLVSEEFLNMVTSGCTGGVVSDPETQNAIKEKFVALEAGWSGFRSQVSERMNDLEESWKSWNLNSLLQFNNNNSPDKQSQHDDKPPVVTTSPSGDFPSHVWHRATTSREDTMTPIAMFPDLDDEVGCTFDRKRMTARHQVDKYADAEEDKCSAIEKIVIGSTEHDVPMSLKDTLANISRIDEGGNDGGGSSGALHYPTSAGLDSSREDSEGGKIILDAAEWDPVEVSDAEGGGVDVDLSTDPDGRKGQYFKHSTSGKVLRSPTSVLVEV